MLGAQICLDADLGYLLTSTPDLHGEIYLVSIVASYQTTPCQILG